MSLRIIDDGDIFASGAQAIVVPTNAVGTQGAGLAKTAARRWPQWSHEYRDVCARGTVKPGDVNVCERSLWAMPRWIVAVATKDHWRAPSRLEWVEAGLRNLAKWAAESPVGSIATPALGCGLGGLAWEVVRPVAERILSPVAESEHVAIMLYAPHKAADGPRSPRRR